MRISLSINVRRESMGVSGYQGVQFRAGIQHERAHLGSKKRVDF
jgi:hypothetical protein